MRKVKGMKLVAMMMLGLIVISSCENWGRTTIEDIGGPDEFTQVSYNFNDASVESKYHRSYEVRVIDSVAIFSVNNGDSVLVNNEIIISTSQKAELKELVSKLKATDEMINTGENGSSSEGIVVTHLGAEKMHINWNQGETSEVTDLKKYLKALFGDVNEIIASTELNLEADSIQ